MTDTMDVQGVVARVNAYLGEQHFVPRDADGSDYQFGDDRRLRFKTGTTRGEVAVQVWINDRPHRVIRILNEDQVIEAFHDIDAVITAHRVVVSEPKSVPAEIRQERHDEYWKGAEGDGIDPARWSGDILDGRP